MSATSPVAGRKAHSALYRILHKIFSFPVMLAGLLAVLAAMDAINNKYGLSTLAPATMLTAFKAAPTRIAFHAIPELF